MSTANLSKLGIVLPSSEMDFKIYLQHHSILDFCMATSTNTVVGDSNTSQQIILVKITPLYNVFPLDTSDLACLVGYIRQNLSHYDKTS